MSTMLHHHPHPHPEVEGPIEEHPITPAGRILDHPLMVALFVVAAIGGGIIAGFEDGTIPLTWDDPIQRWVQDQRNDEWGDLFRMWSRLGSNAVIFSLAAVLAVIASRRSKILALTILGAALTRPVFEFVVKDVIGRPRPEIDQLVPGTGFSNPSGHVLASIALYGLVPAVVALFARRAIWWWVTAAVVVVVVVPMVAISRVYLGVHWPTDVVAGIVLGTLYLLAVEWVFVRLLRRFPGHHESDAWQHLIHPRRTLVEHHGEEHAGRRG
jgi:undecaprenyl-diphosphatase